MQITAAEQVASIEAKIATVMQQRVKRHYELNRLGKRALYDMLGRLSRVTSGLNMSASKSELLYGILDQELPVYSLECALNRAKLAADRAAHVCVRCTSVIEQGEAFYTVSAGNVHARCAQDGEEVL